MERVNIALRRFIHIEAISRQKEARRREYALLLFRMTSRVLYSAQYHRLHCTLHTFEQFGALYMHNHDDKYPARPGFELGTTQLIRVNHRGRSSVKITELVISL